MLNTTDLNLNIDKIEDKCIELISEINQHLSTGINGVKGIKSTTNSLKKKHRCIKDNKERQNVIPSKKAQGSSNNSEFQTGKTQNKLKLLSCHQKIINLSNNPSILHNFKGNVPSVHVTKDMCNKITRINQFLTDGEKHKTEAVFVPQQTKDARKKLNIQRLNHVSITPELTMQTVFKLSLRDRSQKERVRNVGVYEYRHCSASEMIHGEEIHKKNISPLIITPESNGFIDFEKDESEVSSEIIGRTSTETEETRFDRVEEKLNVSSENINRCSSKIEEKTGECGKGKLEERVEIANKLCAGLDEISVASQGENSKPGIQDEIPAASREENSKPEILDDIPAVSHEENSKPKMLSAKVEEEPAESSPTTNNLRFYLFGNLNNKRPTMGSTTATMSEVRRSEDAEGVKHSSLILKSHCNMANDVPATSFDNSKNFATNIASTCRFGESENTAKPLERIEEEETSKLPVDDNESFLPAGDENVVANDVLASQEDDWNDDRLQETNDMQADGTNDEYCTREQDEPVQLALPNKVPFDPDTRASKPTRKLKEILFHANAVNPVSTEKFSPKIKTRFDAVELVKERLPSRINMNTSQAYKASPNVNEKRIETRKIQNTDRTVTPHRGIEDVLRTPPRRMTRYINEEKKFDVNAVITSFHKPLVGRPLQERRSKMSLNEWNSSKLRMEEDAKHVKLLLDIINDCYTKTNTRLDGILPNTSESAITDHLNTESRETLNAEKCSSNSINDDSISDELSSTENFKSTSSSSGLLNSQISACCTASSGEISKSDISPGQIIFPCKGCLNKFCSSSIFTSDYTTSEEGTPRSDSDHHHFTR